LRERSSDIPPLVEHFLRQAEQRMRCPYHHQIEDEGLATLSASLCLVTSDSFVTSLNDSSQSRSKTPP
jgi:hypothetical protein